MKNSNSNIFTIVLFFSLSFLVFAQSGSSMSPRIQNMGETVSLKGEITNVLSPLYRYVRLMATFKTKDKEYTVHLGPVRYWNQENLKLEKGKVEIIGVQEEVEGQWHLYPSKIIQGKNTIALVTDDGFPKWANMRFGKGRMGNGLGGFNGRCGNCYGRW